MKKMYSLLCAATLILSVGIFANSVHAAKPVDNDVDGYKSNVDCNDNDPSINPGAIEVCDGVDNNCDGAIDEGGVCGGGTCTDGDGDGYFAYDAADCPAGDDCDDTNPAVNPGATEVCGNGLDDDCVGGDATCTGGPHDNITGTFNTPADITAKCLECHSGGHPTAQNVANDVVNSLHGMMPTPAPNVTNMTRDSQKLMEINTFCSYPNPDMAGAACLGCHPTLGKYDNLAVSDIDCLRCHNDAYKMKYAQEQDPAKWWYVTDWQGTDKTYKPSAKNAQGDFYVEFNWGAMPGLTATDLIAGVHRPTTQTCLSCHAKAGGGDWTKRGDIGLNSANATAAQDIHLASAANGGAGLSCSDCHVSMNHKIPGRGIDLRPTEAGVAVRECIECHPGMDQGGHAASGRRSEPDRHVKRVACKSCHIPAFGKGGATEMHRDWTNPHWNQALCNGQGAWAGHEVKESNVIPDHVWFDGTSYVYALGETLTKIDPISGYDTVADANGDVNDPLGTSMLVPIKRHQSNMAVMSSGADLGKVIPYDVVWQFMTGLSDEAADHGKAYAGFSGSHEWKWLEAEMGINHGVSPAANVADCTNCHHTTRNLEIETVSKLDKLGYALKDADKNGVVNLADKAIICSQCHQEKDLRKDWEGMHSHTQKGSGIGCTLCHDIERTERGLCEPCNPDGTENTACINEFVDTNYYNHCN